MGGKTLLVMDKVDSNVLKSANNVSKLSTTLVDTLNGYEIMRVDHVLFVKDAVNKIEEKYRSA